MQGQLDKFREDESGQDLIEYSLLLALMLLAAFAIFATSTQNMNGIWERNGEALNRGNALANP